MGEPTRKQIETFVRIRNRAEFHNNLQFGIDCQEAGFRAGDLPEVEKLANGYQWTFSHGILIEEGCRIEYFPDL